MNTETHLLCETIQDISLQAWPIIYGQENKYDLDSRALLETFREWGELFNNWWNSHDQEWFDKNDYLSNVEHFTILKCKEYFKDLHPQKEDELAKDLDSIDNIIQDKILQDLNYLCYSRLSTFLLNNKAHEHIRTCADKFQAKMNSLPQITPPTFDYVKEIESFAKMITDELKKP